MLDSVSQLLDTNNANTHVILIPTLIAKHRPVKADTVELVNAILGHGSSIGYLRTNPSSKNRMVSRHFAMTIITFVLLKQTLHVRLMS
jgi:hypothetical protein